MKVLRNISGASLMFVLATMMLLMVLGVSVILAAGYNVGAGIVQYNRTQLELYSSSMERTIKSAFDEVQAQGVSLTDATTLGGQILREAISTSPIPIFPASVAGDIRLGATTVEVNIIMNLAPGDAPVTLPDNVEATYAITITGQLFVFVNPYERRHTESVFTGGTPPEVQVIHDATPMTMTIAGDLEVELVTTFVPVGNLNQAMPVPYTFDSVTTYRLEQLVLTEGPNPFTTIAKTEDPVLGDMLISSPVVWTVISYESFS